MHHPGSLYHQTHDDLLARPVTVALCVKLIHGINIAYRHCVAHGASLAEIRGTTTIPGTIDKKLQGEDAPWHVNPQQPLGINTAIPLQGRNRSTAMHLHLANTIRFRYHRAPQRLKTLHPKREIFNVIDTSHTHSRNSLRLPFDIRHPSISSHMQYLMSQPLQLMTREFQNEPEAQSHCHCDGVFLYRQANNYKAR